MEATASILIVDDEEDIRQLLAVALRRVGYRVATAADSEQALDMLQANSYQLVVTDLRMPGMDGLSLLRRIADRYPATKGIVLTGFGSIQSAVEATKLGADNYITKPIVIDEFLQVVRSTVERGQSLRAAPSPTLEVSTLAALTRLLGQPALDLQQMAEGAVEVVAATLASHASLTIHDASTGQEIIHVQRGGSGPQPRRPAGAWMIRAPIRPMPAANPTVASSLAQGGGRHLIGSLELWRPPEVSPFTREEAQLLQLAADQISIALGNLAAGRFLAATIRELREASLQTVQALVRAVEMRDRYTAGHSARVARYAVALGRSLGLDDAQIDNLRVAALLHDVGKIGLSDLLLNKPGPLTPEEWTRIQEHPAMGCRIVEGVQSLAALVPLIMHHQERYDGLGYPSRLAGEQIPFAARILAVSDSFEAMTATRAYRAGRSPAEALEILEAGAGQQWDPALVARWRQIVARVLAQGDSDPTANPSG